jgi:ferredoxin/flavodoxin---NADP+ reductase
VIGTNKADAAETVRALLADLGGRAAERPSIETLLESRGVRVVTYDDWLGIDAGEAALARSLDRGERVKLAGWEALRRAYGHDDRDPPNRR